MTNDAFLRALRCFFIAGRLSTLVLISTVSGSYGAIEAIRVAGGFEEPLCLATPPGDTTRMFVVEETGKIKIINLRTKTVNPIPFLDVSSEIVTDHQEQGLLGMTFDPNYAVNGRFYISYVAPGGAFNAGISHVAQLNVSADPDVADPTSERALLTFDQPQVDHNCSWLAFSPRAGDAGNLYIGVGDGGHFDDRGPGHIEPGGNAQSTKTLLGKILRIHIEDAPGTYSIPPNNPYFGSPTEKQEIWLLGLRNPWRCSFDRQKGTMFIGDVGQGEREEVDVQDTANPGGGENYGWRVREGLTQNPRYPNDPPPPDAIDPILDYAHSTGICVIGGYVYRGKAVRDLKGLYVFADDLGPETGDFTGKIWTLRYQGGVASGFTDITSQLFPTRIGGFPLNNPAGFGEDASGELYIADVGNGNIYKIVRGR